MDIGAACRAMHDTGSRSNSRATSNLQPSSHTRLATLYHINSLIAIFTTISKAMVILILAECEGCYS